MIIHTVSAGDTLYRIARHYGVTLERLLADNGIPADARLVVGQTVVVRFPRTVYTVRPGDSPYAIAQAFGISLNTLYRNNPGLQNRSYIQPGEVLVIDYTQHQLGEMEVFGYAYPNVDRALLRNTLPYLSDLMPFTYEFNPDGSLRPLDDTELIAMAKEQRVAPMMHLSNLREPYGFDSELAHQALSDQTVQKRLIDEVEATLRAKGYLGIDVDFENVYAGDRFLLADFLYHLRERLKRWDYPVYAALAAKNSDEMKGLLYEGHDYEAVGRAADGVLLMTYEWGYKYGPPMAIAPIGNVRQTLDYAVTRIRPEKLFVGIPNYGYDWPLPFVQGETAARSISNEEAVAIAAEHGAAINYSATSQAPWFRYQDAAGTTHEVWFEDAKSIRAKLELVAEYGLRGAGYWNLMRPFVQNWTVLGTLYQIKQ